MREVSLARLSAGVVRRAHRLYRMAVPADIAVLHTFVAAPSGGGHQFLRALCREFQRRQLRLEMNGVPPRTRACLFNSHNFNPEIARSAKASGCRMVHRIDGPIGVYRGRDDGTDDRTLALNLEFADATIFQSEYSLRKHAELGREFRNPHVIRNAPDPVLFHSRGRVPFSDHRKIRLISTSWSDNHNKGAAILSRLDELLDWNRFEFTFVGNVPVEFRRIRVLPPMPSETLAPLLREHDVFVAPSRNDPCSNALTEALACGLPAIYLDSGGHPEIVQGGGFAFTDAEEVPGLLDRLVVEYASRQRQITVPSIVDVADRYLQVLGLGAEASKS